ncbi:hypothetical protein BJX66DRAFT_344214 [Aspergillus keveii]|uniref:Sugar transporter n=1 Tax=Aspergillus keveii TaxID=714993 RepID=A0ABR4FMG2_9EURO
MAAEKVDLSLSQRLQHLNPMLIFIMAYISMCSFNFGYDVSVFGGVQAMNQLWPAIQAGSICCGYIAKKWGRRVAILCLTIGVILQTAAVGSAMFTIGRVITFGMAGMAIVVVPIYNAETCPQVLRGMLNSTLQLMISLGSLVASFVTYGTENTPGDPGWADPHGPPIYYGRLSSSYIVVSKAAALHVKEKTNLLACVISVPTTFETSFTFPYLINAEYANLGGKVGYVYESINIVMVALTYFIIPELKGRTLEEVDQLFASGAPLRKFHMVQTRSAQDVYQEEIERKGAKDRTEIHVRTVNSA